MAQAFHHGKEINRAEAFFSWAPPGWPATSSWTCTWTDNGGLQHPQERHGRFHDLRWLYLSVVHRLHGNTWEVRWIAGLQNPADKPSGAILETLHRTGAQVLLSPDVVEERVVEVSRGLLASISSKLCLNMILNFTSVTGAYVPPAFSHLVTTFCKSQVGFSPSGLMLSLVLSLTFVQIKITVAETAFWGADHAVGFSSRQPA